mmetsp:Transcript_3645/g.9016  ORF Transcript_3645/g.9016 Transcript_3645/m.9016 type:complete len:321 (-) Transcript_3645:200-1162(-)
MSSMADAEELLKEAEKHMNKKSMIFRKKPDYERAADCYQKAAQILRSPAVKKFSDAVKAFENASNAHVKAGAQFFGAVAMENAANILRDMKENESSRDRYKKASAIFRDAGNAEKAAESLMKAAKAIAEDDVDSAIKLYLESMSIYEDEEKHIFIGDSWRACLGLMMRHRKVDDAIQLLTRMIHNFELLEQTDYMYKAQLSVVVLLLSKGDSVAASSARDGFGDFMMTREGQAASDLIQAFEDGDSAAVESMTKTQTFTLLENQIARAANNLKNVCEECSSDMTGARANSSKQSSATQKPTEAAASKQTADPDDEMDDLL